MLGFTITQQLVKNILLNNDQTITRKVKELILSIRIENEYSKEFILELYLMKFIWQEIIWSSFSCK